MPNSIERAGLAEQIGAIVAAGLGIVLAVTPVAIWIAWTAALVVWVLLIAVVCAVLLALLETSLQSARDLPGAASADDQVILPEEFIEEVHRIFPLTYHHSRHPRARFRQAMKRLSRLLEASGPGESPR